MRERLRAILVAIIIVALGAGAGWFFFLRPSALVMRSEHGEYRLPVPRTYFMRSQARLPVETPSGTLEITLATASPVSSSMFGFALGHMTVPGPARVLPPRRILREVCTGAAHGAELEGHRFRDADQDDYPGCAIDVRGRAQTGGLFSTSYIEGSIRALLVRDEIVMAMMFCTLPTCAAMESNRAPLEAFRFTAGP